MATGKFGALFFLEAVEQQAIRNLAIAENIRTLYEEMKVSANHKYH